MSCMALTRAPRSRGNTRNLLLSSSAHRGASAFSTLAYAPQPGHTRPGLSYESREWSKRTTVTVAAGYSTVVWLDAYQKGALSCLCTATSTTAVTDAWLAGMIPGINHGHATGGSMSFAVLAMTNHTQPQYVVTSSMLQGHASVAYDGMAVLYGSTCKTGNIYWGAEAPHQGTPGDDNMKYRFDESVPFGQYLKHDPKIIRGSSNTASYAAALPGTSYNENIAAYANLNDAFGDSSDYIAGRSTQYSPMMAVANGMPCMLIEATTSDVIVALEATFVWSAKADPTSEIPVIPYGVTSGVPVQITGSAFPALMGPSDQLVQRPTTAASTGHERPRNHCTAVTPVAPTRDLSHIPPSSGNIGSTKVLHNTRADDHVSIPARHVPNVVPVVSSATEQQRLEGDEQDPIKALGNVIDDAQKLADWKKNDASTNAKNVIGTVGDVAAGAWGIFKKFW